MPFVDKSYQYTGRKASIGRTFVIQVDGKEVIGVFIAYCPDCKSKILLSRDEVYAFCRRYNARRRTLKEKIVRRMLHSLMSDPRVSESF